MKMRQKRWAVSNKLYKVAAGGIRSEIESGLLERIKDIKSVPKKILLFGHPAADMICCLRRDFDCEVTTIERDEEDWHLVIGAFDLVISNVHMHWINDLDKFCTNVRAALNDNGAFIGSLFGGDSLFELRSSLQLAQQDIEQGVSPRVSPMISVKDLASLLFLSKFHDVAIDSEDMQVKFPSLQSLLRDLQLMGESNALILRKPYIRRDLLKLCENYYLQLYGDSEKNIPGTFQILSFIGWKMRLDE